MSDRDVLLAKISIIKNCLRRIREATGLKPEMLDDFDKQDIFVLNLQRAIQACIAMAQVIIAMKGYGVPNSYRMAFRILYEHGWLDLETAERMEKMVGFRNIAIHDYQSIDRDILKSILTKHLSDFEQFYKQIWQKFEDGED